MNKFILLFLFTAYFTNAQEIVIPESKLKKSEKRWAFTEYKYESGDYEEAILNAAKIADNSNGNIVQKVKGKILQAKALIALFRFSEAEIIYKEAIKVVSQIKEEKELLEANLLVADFLTDNGRLAEAEAFLNKIPATIKLTEKEKYDIEFTKAKWLISSGYNIEALEILVEQENYRLRMAKKMVANPEDSYYFSQTLDFNHRKSLYASILNLKGICLLEQGLYQKADTAILNSKLWIQKNLNKKHPLYRQELEKEANLAKIRNNPKSAADLFRKAYQAQNFPEHEQHKIVNLSALTLASIESGDVIYTNKYLRRLQMHAFRKVGKTDPFQIAYEYAKSGKFYFEGNFTTALKRLEKLRSYYSFLPDWHHWNLALLELEGKIALKGGDLNRYKKCLDKTYSNYLVFYGDKSPATHKAKLALAVFEVKYGSDYLFAGEVFQNSYEEVVSKVSLKGGRDQVIYLTASAELYNKLDNPKKAAEKSAEATEAARISYGDKSVEYLKSFSDYVEYSILSGNYKESFINLEKAYNLVSEIKGGNNDLRQNVLLTLSRLFTITGDIEKSQTLLAQAYKLSMAGYEKQLLAEAENLEQKASLYFLSGNYARATKSLLNALSIRKKNLKAEHPMMISLYQKLAKLYLVSGNYALAEEYIFKAENIIGKVYGSNSIRLSENQLILAEYYQAIGDFQKAETICKTADKTIFDKLGLNNLKRAEILIELAHIKVKTGKYKSSEIEALYADADRIIKNGLGENNALSASLAQKQAEFYLKSNKFRQAEPLIDYAESYWATKLGKENRYAAALQRLRGDIAYNEDNFEQAGKYYSKSRHLYGSIFSEKHPGYIKSSGKLARTYYMKQDIQKSLEISESVISGYHDYIVNHFPSLSFREKGKFWNNIKEEFEFFNFLSINQSKNNPKLSEKVYNNIISTKALLLNSDIQIRDRIFSSNDSLLIDHYNELTFQKEFLTSSLALTKQQLSEQNINLKSIEDKIENLEKSISKRSEIFKDEEKKKKSTVRDIKKLLKENEYAVEIIRYRWFDKTFADSVIYAALITNHSYDIPKIVLFPNGSKMEKNYLSFYRNMITFNLEDKNSYSSYWKHIDDKIPDGAIIFLSADGVYNQINLEMLLDEAGNYIIDKNDLVFVTNTRDLLNYSTGRKTPDFKNSDFLLCGNPAFYTLTDKPGHIASLPGAEKEVFEINRILEAQSINTKMLTQKEVTEERVKNSHNPTVFHIATHGYFKESNNTDEDEYTSNPLLNSGLLLHGAGDILGSDGIHYVNSKEGILTAYEASSLKFHQTELVVLSACETGRGKVKTGEGVYGLQRSFLVAGADAVIMSLFKVNDEVTKKLMVIFYSKWLKSGNKREAFAQAKREIKQEYDNPLFWGAFIMIEGKPMKDR